MAEHVSLEVQGMGCDGCVAAVQSALLAVPGVRSAKVDLAAGRAEIEHDGVTVAALVGAIDRAGYDAKGP